MLLGALLASFVLSLPVRGEEDVNIIIVDPNAPGSQKVLFSNTNYCNDTKVFRKTTALLRMAD